MSELVLREDDNGLCVLTLNRPDTLNALSPKLFVELRAHSFCQQEHFPFAFHFALPDINRLHSRKDLHASGQPPGDEHLSDAPGFRFIRRGHKDDNCF